MFVRDARSRTNARPEDAASPLRRRRRACLDAPLRIEPSAFTTVVDDADAARVWTPPLRHATPRPSTLTALDRATFRCSRSAVQRRQASPKRSTNLRHPPTAEPRARQPGERKECGGPRDAFFRRDATFERGLVPPTRERERRAVRKHSYTGSFRRATHCPVRNGRSTAGDHDRVRCAKGARSWNDRDRAAESTRARVLFDARPGS